VLDITYLHSSTQRGAALPLFVTHSLPYQLEVHFARGAVEYRGTHQDSGKTFPSCA